MTNSKESVKCSEIAKKEINTYITKKKKTQLNSYSHTFIKEKQN